MNDARTPALAFCNDVDYGTWKAYVEVHGILRELGIAAEDSVFLYAPAGSELALFRDSVERKGPRHEELLEEIRSGRISVLHGAGEFSASETPVRPTRRMVAEALEYLDRTARVPSIWTNHGDEGNLSNIGGAAPTYHEGDRPDSDAYILDLLVQAGVRYFWADHHASNDFVFAWPGGGAAPASASAGRRARGDAPPPLVVEEGTRAGLRIRCFRRFRGPLPRAPDAETLAWQLAGERLDRLLEKGGVSVLYQHWYVRRDPSGRPVGGRHPALPDATVAALRRLAELARTGTLRVVGLSELLG